MFKKLIIQNFQSHKHTEIEFNTGVNTIIGSSDSGKTAILRALRWVLFNKPGGDEFRSHWGGDTIVKLILVDGNVIERIKTNSKNLYKLNDTEFMAFGSDVPDEIKGVLNISDINLQKQFDSHFLLSETAGNVSSHFNRIAKLHKIDIGLQNAQQALNKTNKQLDSKKDLLRAKKETLNKFVDIDSFESIVDVLEKTITEKTNLEKKVTKFQNSIFYVEHSQNEIKKQAPIIKQTLFVFSELENLFGTCKKENTQIENLQKQIRNLTNIQSKIQVKQNVVQAIDLVNFILSLYDKQNKVKEQRIDLKKKAIALFNTSEKIKKYEKIKNAESLLIEIDLNIKEHMKDALHLTNLQKLIVTTTQIKGRLKTAENSLKSDIEFFNKNMPDVCPLCGNKTHKEL